MYNELFEIFGIKVDNIQLVKSALTHPSCTHENSADNPENYERLEFLGDAVLKLAVSSMLYEEYPEFNEGKLSKIRSFLVADNLLAKLSFDLGLNKFLILSKSEEKCGGRKRVSNNACAFEALLGAFYLDGKVKEINEFLYKILKPEIPDIINNMEKYNAKELLQEYTQSKDKTLPDYNVVKVSGPPHKPCFEVEVVYDNAIIGKGDGFSKKEAQQNAAFNACKKLGLIN